MSTLTLVAVLAAPLVIIGAVAFLLIVLYVNRVARVTAELEARRQAPVCPACGHRLVEAGPVCAQCGAPVGPPPPETAQGPG